LFVGAVISPAFVFPLQETWSWGMLHPAVICLLGLWSARLLFFRFREPKAGACSTPRYFWFALSLHCLSASWFALSPPYPGGYLSASWFALSLRCLSAVILLQVKKPPFGRFISKG